MSGIKLAVLDDGLFVRTHSGSINPVAATFHRYVEAVARSGSFERVRYLVPVRSLRIWEDDPPLPPVDETVLEVVPTAWFAGIADYLARAAYLTARNWRPVNRALADSDLLWLRLPASNALLAMAAARRQGVPYFGMVASNVGDVVDAQSRPLPLDWVARAAAAGYDSVSRLAARGGPVADLTAELFHSIVTADQVEATRAFDPKPEGPPWQIAWAGRMAGEKGLSVLFEATRLLLEAGCDVNLVLVGDGPERRRVEFLAAQLPPGRATLYGYVGDREAYLDVLRGAHLLVHPSPAEAVPKVLVEAMTAGLPIVAARAGAVADVLGNGARGRLVPADDARAVADAVRDLLEDPAGRAQLRERGLAWAADHTAERQADKMTGWLREQLPQLHW